LFKRIKGLVEDAFNGKSTWKDAITLIDAVLKTEPIYLDIDFCAGCGYDATERCDGCIRVHLNMEQDHDEDWRDKWKSGGYDD